MIFSLCQQCQYQIVRKSYISYKAITIKDRSLCRIFATTQYKQTNTNSQVLKPKVLVIQEEINHETTALRTQPYNPARERVKDRLLRAGSAEVLANEMEINKEALDMGLCGECLALLQSFHKANPARVKDCFLQQWIPVGMRYLDDLDDLDQQSLYDGLRIISELNVTVADAGIVDFLKKLLSKDTLKFVPKDKNNQEILSMYLGMMEFLSKLLSDKQLFLDQDFDKCIISYLQICFTYIILNSDHVQEIKQIVKASKIFKNLQKIETIPELHIVMKTIIQRNLKVKNAEELRALADCCQVNSFYTTTQKYMGNLVYSSIPEKVLQDNSRLQELYQGSKNQRKGYTISSFFQELKTIEF